MKVNVGIDIGGTKTIIGFVDELGAILCQSKIPTSKEDDFSKFASKIADEILKLKKSYNKEELVINGVGIGIAGQIDPKTSIILGSPNLGWTNVDLKGFLEKELSLPVYLENDVRSAVLGEYAYGFQKKYKNMVLIAVGTGIGGGIILNGRLLKGANNVASEIGHMIYNKDGHLCNCGRKGCVEAYSGGSYLKERVKEFFEINNLDIPYYISIEEGKFDIKSIETKKEEGDKIAIKLWEHLFFPLGIITANIVTLLNPELVVLGGGIVQASPSLVNYVENVVKNNSMIFSLKDIVITKSKLGTDANMLGASILVDQNKETSN